MDQSPPQPPNQGGDFASRFRRPGDAPAPAAQAAPPGPPRPQGLVQMLEDTLTAPFQLGALFSALAQQPPPGYAVMTANLAAYWAAFFGVNLLHVAITDPKALEAVATRAPIVMAAAGLGALLFVSIGSFAAAGLLHAAVSLAGGQGDYRRSYQVLSLVSLVAPLQAVMNWAPMLWPLPVAAGAYMTAVACEHLHRAPPLRVRGVFGALMLAVLGVQWLARVQIERATERYRAMRQSAELLQQVGQQLQAAPGLPSADSTGLVAPPMGGLGAGAPGLVAPPSGSTGQAPQGPSSLDLLAAPSGKGASPMTPERVQQITQAGAGMLQAVTPMLNDPNLLKNLPPDQARRVQETIKIIGKMQADLQSGKAMNPKDQAELMRQVMSMQQMMLPPKGVPPRPRRAAPEPGANAP